MQTQPEHDKGSYAHRAGYERVVGLQVGVQVGLQAAPSRESRFAVDPDAVAI